MIDFARYTINADDFGKNAKTTAAIAKSFDIGLINQTTLMVNMPNAINAVDVARKSGFSDRVGLHLNLTEGVPLTETMRHCSAFCNEDGTFCGKFLRSPWETLAPAVAKAVSDEIEAQCQAYCDYGLPLMHCDGHHHIQSRLPIARVLFPILSRYGFRSVRRPSNTNHRSLHLQLQPRISSLAWNILARRYHLRRTDVFGGWDAWEKWGHLWPRHASVEIMVHPGYSSLDGGIIDISNFQENTGRCLAGIVNCL